MARLLDSHHCRRLDSGILQPQINKTSDAVRFGAARASRNCKGVLNGALEEQTRLLTQPSRNEGTSFQGLLELRRGTGAREHLVQLSIIIHQY